MDKIESIVVSGVRGAPVFVTPKYFRRPDGSGYLSSDPESGSHVETAVPVLTRADEAKHAIQRLEIEQEAVLTPRAIRELFIDALTLLGQTTKPAFVALKSLDDRIAVERVLLSTQREIE